MARLYKVSADTSEKEKIIGGILTLGQGIWIATGALLTAGIFLSLVNVMPASIAFALGAVPGGLLGGIFAFYQKEELPLMTYLTYKYKFEKKTKYLVNTVYSLEAENEPPLFK